MVKYIKENVSIIDKMVGNLLNKQKRSISEPPKFDLDDLPEPPKLNDSNLETDIPTISPRSIDIPEAKTIEPIKENFPLPPQLDNLSKEVPIKNEETKLPEKIRFPSEVNKIQDDLPRKIDLPKIDTNDTSLATPPIINEKAIVKQKQKKGFFSMFRNKKKLGINDLPSLEMPPVPIEKTNLTNNPIKPDKNLPIPPSFNKLSSDIKMPVPPTLDGTIINSSKQMDNQKDNENSNLSKSTNLPNITNLDEHKDFMPPSMKLETPIPVWIKEGEEFRENELLDEAQNFLATELEQEGKDFLENEMKQEAEDFIKKETPLSQVKGVGPKRAKILKKAGIKTAEHLALKNHKKLAEEIKIPESHAKRIVNHAKKITKIKNQLKSKSKSKDKSISDVIKQLETERKEIDKLQKEDINEDKIIELEGHKEIIKVLEKLEGKRNELNQLQKSLEEKELKLDGHKDSYKRDFDYIDNLKRRLDHDVRERTQYLINMEKEYFQKAQKLANKQSELDIKEKNLPEKESYLKEQELIVKKKVNDLEDKEITITTKEKKLQGLMNQLESQDEILKEKEDDLIKRESEYMQKLDTLETHEKAILKNLEEQRKSLEQKEKEIELREKRIYSKQRNVDKKEISVEYAKNIIEEEKNKLIDDEFEQYLHDQLKGVNSGITFGDMNTLKNLKIPDLSDKNRSIYQLIDSCKDMLRNSKVSEAKVFYNQIRDRYYDGSFDSNQEKESIHNMIRTLYDEINLADIGRNR